MKNNQKHYRQGDLLITSIKALPKDKKAVAREGGRLILAHGKSTGHNHAIATAKCAMFASKAAPGSLFLQVTGARASLTHDEHSTIALPKGAYQVTRQREFSSAAVRRVED